MRSAPRSAITSPPGSPEVVPFRAILIFAEQLGLDLAKRRLPQYVRTLFDLRVRDSAVGADVHVFTGVSASRSEDINVHPQVGSSFAARLENAVATVTELGYNEVVLIGRDCPQLEVDDVAEAFAQLADHRLVLGPDHRGGCYLIGVRTRDRRLLGSVRWNRNTDFAELSGRCRRGSVHTLAVKHDLDSWADVASLAGSGGAVAQLAVFFIRVLTRSSRSWTLVFDAAAQRLRIRWQMPPPALAA